MVTPPQTVDTSEGLVDEQKTTPGLSAPAAGEVCSVRIDLNHSDLSILSSVGCEDHKTTHSHSLNDSHRKAHQPFRRQKSCHPLYIHNPVACSV
jgi:hypothetical protein